jgi:hypothetical protein
MQEGIEKRGRRVCEVLRPVTLPVSEGGKTLRKLTLLGYDGARIYPSYKGAADALAERSRWTSVLDFHQGSSGGGELVRKYRIIR